MFLALMYHHINNKKYSNNLELIEKHFEYIAQNFQPVFCNETKYNNCIMLVFDDAFFDFYYYVFPLLKKYNLKAILSVPTKYIVDQTEVKYQKRLSITHDDIMYNKHALQFTPFCTWTELKEMSDSKYVKIASHSVNHTNLITLNNNNIKFELRESQKIIENKLKIKCDIFTYPYGNHNHYIKTMVNKYYKYDVTIGNIYNLYNANTIYRIYADDLNNHCQIFNFKNRLKYMTRTLLHLIKGIIYDKY